MWVIARLAERVRPEPRALPDEDARRLAEPVARRRQLVEIAAAEAERRRRARDPGPRRRIGNHLARLREALAEVDADPSIGSGAGSRRSGASLAGLDVWSRGEVCRV